MSYHDLVGFEALCLEDSWILAIHEAPELVAFAMEFSLLATHPLCTPPQPGEAHCYIRGNLIFEEVSARFWSDRGAPPARGPDDEEDLGSIDVFDVNGDEYTMVGDFGRLVIAAGPPRVELATGTS